jgi:superoxide dismutase
MELSLSNINISNTIHSELIDIIDIELINVNYYINYKNARMPTYIVFIHLTNGIIIDARHEVSIHDKLNDLVSSLVKSFKIEIVNNI